MRWSDFGLRLNSLPLAILTFPHATDHWSIQRFSSTDIPQYNQSEKEAATESVIH